MKIAQIAAKNLMGASFDLALGALTFITGDNLRGKTRVANAIKLALLGYLPGLEKTGRGIFKLASGNPMEVTADLKETIISADKHTENWQSRIHRSWEEGFGRIKTKDHVPQELDGTTPVAMMDASDYFTRSARARVELVFSVAKIEGGSTEELLKGVEKEFSKEAASALAKLPNAAGDVQAWLEQASEWCEKKRSAEAAQARILGGTLQGNTSLSLERPAAKRSVFEIDAGIEALVADITKAEHERTTLELEQDNNIAAQMKREELQEAIEEAGGPPSREYDIDALRGRLSRLTATVKKSEEAKRAHEVWAANKAEIEEQFEKATIALATAQAFQVSTEVAAFTCGECGSEVGKTKASKQRIIMAREAERKEQIDTRAQILANKSIAKAEFEKQGEPPQPEDVAVDRAELQQVVEEIDAYTRDAKTSAMVTKLKSLPEPVDHSERIAQLKATLTTLRPAVEATREERRQAEMDRADNQRLAEAKQAHGRAQEEERLWKSVKTFLIARKGDLIGEAFKPLLATAERFTKGIMATPFEYRDGEFGYQGNGPWVSADVFSGTEQVILYAALQCALGAQSPCRIIIVDELGRMSDGTAMKFLSNVMDARELFEQFIVISPREIPLPLQQAGEWTKIIAENNNYATVWALKE